MTELSGASHVPGPPDGKDILGSIGVLLPNLECKVCGNSLYDTHIRSGERKGKRI